MKSIMRPVEISVCIPAYKNAPLLKRLLESIQQQSFRDYEIIITDDSPDDSVENLVRSFYFSQPLKYFRNTPSLGTPENWNEAIRHASGNWIKVMHNDDWFRNENALQLFYDHTERLPGCSFFFAAFQNVIEETGVSEIVTCNVFDRFFLGLSPLHLFKRVYVVNPSCTLVKRDADIFYDRNFKFVVDFDYYIRFFHKLKTYAYIKDVLINVGLHDRQVTKYTFLVPEVQIPENILLLKKMGIKILKNPFVYDYYWRLFRNLKIKNTEDVKKYYPDTIQRSLQRMIKFQSAIAPYLLKKGFFSKLFMSVSYIMSFFAKP